jgi:hypothetical protein
MTSAIWKRQRPSSFKHALELCTQYALKVHNRSIPRIAELMGEHNHHNLYKWLANGRIPGVLIPAFEHACGIDYVTQHLAARGNKLVIEIPTGRKTKTLEISELQILFGETVSELSRFYEGSSTADETLAGIENAIRGLAYHHCNVSKSSQPELELDA